MVFEFDIAFQFVYKGIRLAVNNRLLSVGRAAMVPLESDRRPLLILLAFSSVVLAWSAYRPYSYDVWVFEVSLGLVGLAVLTVTYPRFRFSNLVYILVGIHFAILCIGAKYTYAEMPLFNWLRDTFGLPRNYYDRVGHFAQGFIPAIIVREILIRKTDLKPRKMVGFLSVAVCLAASAFYEFIEWWVVIFLYPNEGAEWLGLQGDIWDAQCDMFMAFLGATLSVLLLTRLHDRSMARLRN